MAKAVVAFEYRCTAWKRQEACADSLRTLFGGIQKLPDLLLDPVFLGDSQPIEPPDELPLEIRTRLDGDVRCPGCGGPGWSARFVVSHNCLRWIGSVIRRQPVGEVRNIGVAPIGGKRNGATFCKHT